VAGLRLEAELVHEHAFGHDPGVVAIEREFADRLAIQVLRCANPAGLIYVDCRVPEAAVWKDGDCDEG
jgi:hypothetical protein